MNPLSELAYAIFNNVTLVNDAGLATASRIQARNLIIYIAYLPLNLLVTKCEQRTEQVPAAAAAAADKDEPWASTHKIALQLPNLLSMIHC
jgi:hypothetical protein